MDRVDVRGRADASMDTSNPTSDRQRKIGHHIGELRPVSGRLHPPSENSLRLNNTPREHVEHERDFHEATSRCNVT